MMKKSIIIFAILFVTSISKVICNQNQEPFDIGLGFGGNYGFLGLNINTPVNRYIHLFYSIGLRPPSLPDYLATRYDEKGYQWNWGVGIRFQGPPPDAENVQFRGILYYGINTWTEHYVNPNDTKHSPIFLTWGKGFSIGWGLTKRFLKLKNLGFDVDFFFTLQSESFLPKEIDINGNEKYPLKSMAEGFASVGLRYYFDVNLVSKRKRTIVIDNPL
jgi:hypothetical protein